MIRFSDCECKATLKAAAVVGVFLLFVVVAGFGQVVNLSVSPTTTTLPDGTTVPMWGYFCGTTTAATCAPLNPGSAPVTTPPTSPTWSPVVITVPPGPLTINLTNNLTFLGGANTIPTSIVIVGQVGGGLGSSRTASVSPSHTDAQGCPSWFIASANIPPGAPCTTSAPLASPPTQGPRVQSMATEVAANGTAALTWVGLKPGTYLLESGTHPSIQVPMGLIGVLVVTTAPSGGNSNIPTAAAPGIAYPAVGSSPAVQYNAEVPFEFSEIDPVQNAAVDLAVRTAGFSETTVWSGMNGNVVASVNLTSGGSGYSTPPSVTIAGGGGAGAAATAAIAFPVGSVSVTSGGTGYAVGNQIGWTDGGGAGAVATVASIGAGGSIATVNLTSSGSGYTAAPTVVTTLTGTGSGAALATTLATSNGSVTSITLTSVGAGYTKAPSVMITGSATATAVVVTPGCGQAHNCYPPAVNYTPFYYLINGVAFNKTAPTPSVFAATAGLDGAYTSPTPLLTDISGTVLVRLVNAGLRMHVPSIVGSLTRGFDGTGASTTVGGFTLIAEDGNVIPGVAPAGATVAAPVAPRVQTDVFMAAGKTYDVMVNVPALPSGASATPALPIYDRELSLSANSSERDAGMLAYICVNNSTPSAGLPVQQGTGVFAAAQAIADTYNSVVPCSSAPCTPLVVSDASKGVIANDINVYGVQLSSSPNNGTLTCTLLGSVPGICANGTFTYTPNPGWIASTTDTFSYCANGAAVGTTGLCTTVTLGTSTLSGTLTAIAQSYTAKTATYVKIPSPGLLLGNSDPNNLALSVAVPSAPPAVSLIGASTTGMPTVVMDAAGGFVLSVPGNTSAGSATFTYTLQNSQGNTASNTVTVNFPAPSGLQVTVLDAQQFNNCAGNGTCISTLTGIGDYRWIIEEDKTFWIDPNCTTNGSGTSIAPGCPGPVPGGTIPTFGVQFHTSTMDFVAQGCTGPLSCEGGQTMLDTRPACTGTGTPAGCSMTAGQHIPAVCDLGNGGCRPDPTGNGFTPVLPSSVVLDPTKRYYISVLPGDAGNPFPAYVGQPACNTSAPGGTSTCGHTMSGAPIPPACNILLSGSCTGTFSPVTVLSLPTPLPTGKLSVIVFEDDFPLNGEQDGGGGNGDVAPIEPGLGGFSIVLWDTYGGLGDVTGQNTYDMFNQPLSNSLAGTIDPTTGFDACPLSPVVTSNVTMGDGTQQGITGMIVTCPKYESDGQTLSPLAGQAVIANLMPEKFSVQAYPAADRIARGEEWIQTNTLDGQHPHDSFIRIGEPSYFQEYGPAGYHVAIGFANPAIINARHNDVCNGAYGTVGACTGTVTGQVDVQRLSRTPDQRLYPSGSRDAFAWTQCWVSLGDPDAEDFMFTKCDANGNFRFTNVPGGNWRLTIGDQWNDQIIDGLSTPANVTPGQTLNLGNIGVQQWQANLYTRTFIDDNKNGIWDPGEIGIPLIYTMIHYRDGHNANSLTTDFNGIASFNETFPLFNWYVVEADSGRYKTTGIHTVYDAGGPADGSPYCGGSARPCGKSTTYNFLANTYESVPLPSDLSVPGAVYCASADCAAESSSFAAGTPILSPGTGGASAASTGRIDPPWVWAEGWSGMTSQGNWIEFGKAPYASCPPACATVTFTPPGSPTGTTPTTMQVAENGGIHGIVVYASTRPFDSAQQMIQQPWEPNVPRVTVNLYQEGFAADNVTPTLTLVDTTQTSSWDDWAQGFYPKYTDPATGTPKPYLSCPGQSTTDPFYYTLYGQPNYLDWYNNEHSGGMPTPLPYNSQFKCYDSMHIWNQVQPAPYDGKYSFPSVTGIDPTTGKLLAAMGSTNGVASSMSGTNCTVCVPNPDTTDAYRVGTPMLPPGKYVVEVVMPPGYEIYKEEDKNLLIGDNFIAPVTQQFAGLGGDIFIIPDQAAVASLYDPNATGYNPNNFQNQTANLSLQDGLSGVPGFPGFQDPNWPCVGEMRVVPDYLSLFPQVKEVAPFAGATRPLCDRKEVSLGNQMSVSAKFFVYTSTHIASKFTGVITDDMTSEFDPFSPQFGEKFAPPNMPISTKDYLGNELSRVYSDHWGIYDGLTFSSWDVNPPNITGYSPSMMVQCMNDPGPIPDPSHPGQTMTDPLYNPAYSNFCYEEPYMPGLTTYLDTPVVPTQAFVGAAYNNPDCSYPDATPAVASVTSSDASGPWVSAAGSTHTLTINALGDQQVTNSAYSGPSASAAPFNMKTVTHHYGFGSWCQSLPTTGCTVLSSVTIGGQAATIGSWSDTQITVTVPSGVPACAVQQQTQYSGSAAQCGQLVITAGNGQQSVDTVTVTIGGKPPVATVDASHSIQAAIDAAQPGDLIIVGPGTHTEMLIMWKPVRLQGVGAVSSVINANAHPSGKLLDPWRRHINCLFGLTMSGVPYTASTGSAPYDPTGTYNCPETTWQNFKALPNNPQIDRLPLEATLGWDATLNGNLAEQLQEPSLMGAYEGAGITVLAKGLEFHGLVPWSDTTEGGAFPTGTTLLTGVGSDPTALPTGDANPFCHTVTYNPDGTLNTITNDTNPYPSNFMCNPSSIDGLSVINSSQGGGGIFAHGWAHYLQIANNRVYNNAGTLSGGISVGQGEFPIPYVVGGTANAAPGSCSDGTGLISATGQHLPYCLQLEVNVHNNYITNNSSLGDELFSATLAGGGGVTFCTGNDYYKFNYNWVCGNVSAGEGGGLVHLGEIQNGDIEHNSIVFNQSTNPTIPTNGGGIQVMGTPDTDPVCGTQSDADCPPGLSDGIGHNLTINANLIQGNAADSGSGGGIRLQQVNGTEVSTFPTQPTLWNNVSITNNIIVNNLAGWDGAGISLQDSLNVSIVNNTIVSNDSLASSGVLTYSIGAPSASSPAGGCTQPGPTGPTSASCPQSAGVTSTPNTSLLTTTFTGTITCPFGEPSTGSSSCTGFSNPLLANNVIWQNRSFYIGITAAGSGSLNQQNLVSLFNAFTGTAAPTQSTTGACGTGASYWDIGVRGDTGPGNHSSTFALSPMYSLLDDPGYTTGLSLTVSSTPFVSQYCNGSRVPPECTSADGCSGPNGYGVPPGIVDAQAPNPVFSLTPSATVDEGNNWINVSWGPLAASNPAVTGGPNNNYGGGGPLGNYAPSASSPLIDAIGNTSPTWALAPPTDFFGNPRPDSGPKGQIDIGAVEIQKGSVPAIYVTPNPMAFGLQLLHAPASATVTVSNGGDGPLTIGSIGVTGTSDFAETNNCPVPTASLPASGSCQITITFTPSVLAAESASLVITSSDPATPSLTVPLTGTGAAPVASIAPTTLAFGNQFVGTTSAAQTVTLSNTGNWPLTVASILPGDATDYAVTNSCGGSVAPSSSCTISIAFAPKAMNALNTTLTVTDNSLAVPGSTQTVSITGFGIQNSASLSSTSVSFGVGLITATTPTQTITLTNTGNWPLTISSIGLSGTNANQFSLSGSTCPIGGTGLAPGTCTINVAFSPTSIGSKTASLTFTDNSNGVPGTTQSVALSGTAVNTIVTPASLTFPSTPVGGTSPLQTLTLRNVSGGAPKAIGITFSGPFARATPPGSCGGSLPNNGTCTINVVFRPTSAGTASGSVAVTLAGTAVGNSPVALSGTAPTVPTLTSISPNTGVRGDTPVNVTLTGTNLAAPATVNVSGTGITVSSVSVVNSTTVTATFTIAAGAGLSARNVTVTTPGGTTGSVTFTVVAPTLASITPTSGVRGTNFGVTITGNGLATATTASVSGTGVTVSGFTAVNDTTVTATFTIAPTATVSTRNVTVSTPSGNVTLTGAFTVQGPTLATISPTTGVRGTTVPVTLTGTNLTGATAVTVSGTGVTCTVTGTPTATTVTASCVITPGAALTARNVTVTTPIGTTGAVTFTVTGATVTFAGPTPALNTGGTSTKNGTITVNNAATATGPLTLTANPTIAKTSGTGNGTFSIVTGGTCISGAVVNPGGSCTILVQYSGETNTSTANGAVTITGTGLAGTTLTSASFPAN